MDKKKQVYIMFHTVEEGKNMDREKLNMKIVDAVFKTTLFERIVIWAVVIGSFLYLIIRLIAGR